ncbi:unnamed protein product, partial [Scytosiphon promiscuus]
LAGPIPPELGKLTALVELRLGNNQLSGPIPPELGNLAALQHLQLQDNKLSGPIPKELGALSGLKALWLQRNQLGGAEERQCCKLSQLRRDGACKRQKNRQLAARMLLTHALAGHVLEINKIAPIFSPICSKDVPRVPKLRNFVLAYAWVTRRSRSGAFIFYSPLSSCQMRLFAMITGTIAEELGKLTALEALYLSGNNLSGHMPPRLGDLGALERLDLLNNKLDGVIPPQLGALNKLMWLDLSHNQLSGVIPPQLGNLSTLKTLILSHNEIADPIKHSNGSSCCRFFLATFHPSVALWDHTQGVQDIGHEEGALSLAGEQVPSQLDELLDVLDRTSERNDFGVVGFSLQFNPWAEPPESIVDKGPKAIRGYFEDLYADSCRVKRNSVKIILVGQEGAGKTSLRQSMRANKAAPTGEWKKESTVFADVELMEIRGASVRVYDCAGQARSLAYRTFLQVAYTGLLQMFLTPRAVCVLVCNAEAFGQRGGGGGQDKEDCRKLEELRVCDWLRSISWRVPDNDVILVATKCDLAGGNSREMGRRMEKACRTWLKVWVRDGLQPARLEDGVCLTSCYVAGVDGHGEGGAINHAPEGSWACDWRDSADEDPSPSLLHRLVYKRDGSGLRGGNLVLPRSWDIALLVLEAIERERDPVEMVLETYGGETATEKAQIKTDVYQGITVKDLSTKWEKVVLELDRRGITVTNAKNALEGALSIREFDGSLVRYEKYIFLDVVWLARILKLLLNHKEEEEYGVVHLGDAGDTRVTLENRDDIASLGRLKSEGILEPRLARAMWPAGLSDYVVPTLRSLGLAFPLENDEGLVVLLRLEEARPDSVGKVIDEFCSDQTPEFTASWKVFLGAPPGAIEKVLTRCCSLGGVRTFWRSGVLVHGGFGDRSEIFAVVVEYSSSDNELTAQVYGDISTPAPWTALSYVISTVGYMLLEFPGLRSVGSLECPQHGAPMLLADKVSRRTLTPFDGCPTNSMLMAGENLLEDSGCRHCSPETAGLGAAAVELLRLVDIRLDRGEIHTEIKKRFVDVKGRYSFPRPAVSRTNSTGETVLSQKIDKLTEAVEGVGSRVEVGLGELKDDLGKVKGGVDDVKDKLDEVAASIQASLMCLKGLQAPNYPYPHLVKVQEIVADDASSRAQEEKDVPMKRRLTSCCVRLRGLGTKEMTLQFLCPVDGQEVPCGFGGEGYRFRETRDWVKKISPVLQVALVTAKVALQATTALNVDLSGYLKDVSDGLFEELVDHVLDEHVLEGVVSGEAEVSADMEQTTRVSYELLKKFMEKEEGQRRKNARFGDGYVDFRDKMEQVSDGKGGMVWIRNENVGKWLSSLP